MPTRRRLFLCGALLCAALSAVALYFQYVMDLEPCPLCIVQRALVIALALLMGVAAVHDPGGAGRRIYGALILLLAAPGAGVAGRHVYLQNLPPDQVPECGPGLDYILRTFPPGEALALVFRGSGECAEVQWTFLGLTIPGWTLVVFAGLAFFGVFLCVARGPAASRSDRPLFKTKYQ